jgi:hypothetical protein
LNLDSKASGLSGFYGDELTKDDKFDLFRQQVRKQEHDIDVIIELNKEILDPTVPISEFGRIKQLNQ